MSLVIFLVKKTAKAGVAINTPGKRRMAKTVSLMAGNSMPMSQGMKYTPNTMDKKQVIRCVI